MVVDPGPGRRTGGRSARVRRAVLAATLAALREDGSALSVPTIARRAGVHESSIYRRWGTVPALILDALGERIGEGAPVPDTGSLRGDLLRYARASAAFLRTPTGTAFAWAASAAPSGEVEAGVRRTFWLGRLDAMGAIFRRAEERGEIASAALGTVALEALLGGLFFHLLVAGGPLDDEFVDRLTEQVVLAAVTIGERD